jgi:hypothetical protein
MEQNEKREQIGSKNVCCLREPKARTQAKKGVVKNKQSLKKV